MSAHQPFELPPVQNKPRALRLLKWGAGLLLGAVAAWLLWQWANDMAGVRREAPKVPTIIPCLLYTSPSPRDRQKSRMPSSA